MDPHDIIIIMVLLWDCFDIAVILLRSSHHCCGIAIGVAGVLLRYRCGIDVESPVALLGIAVILLWQLVLWSCCVSPLIAGGDCCETAMVLLWKCFCFTAVLLRY